MGKEGQPIQNRKSDLELVQVRDENTNKVMGHAVIFRDPYLVSQSAWRELFSTHVFSDDPADIAMISHDNEIMQVDSDKLNQLRYFPLQKRRNILNELAFNALDSEVVIFTREK